MSDHTTPAATSAGSRFGGCLLALWLIGATLFAVRLEDPPAPVPATAPMTEFSAERAFRIVEQVARVPHRTGTPNAAEVRGQLADELRALGMEPHLQTAQTNKGDRAAWPVNLWARLAGTANTKAFLLLAHYDSTPYGPGAADATSCVAAILEALRAIKAGPPLKNDLLVVFTDAEEGGLWGAKALAESPLASGVGLLLNLEARGLEGPSYLFETHKQNGWLVPHMAKALSHPRSSSLMFTIYDRLPFSTDYHMLRDTIPGMNVAFVGRFPFYHTINDRPSNLDLRSLQHHGSYALSAARSFGNLPLDEVPRLPDPVYFCVGDRLFWYPAWTNVIQTSLLTLATLLILGRARATGVIASAGVRAGLWESAGLTLLSGSICGLLLGGAFLWNRLPLVYSENILYGSGFFVTVAVVLEGLRRRVGDAGLAGWYGGVLIWWVVVMNAGMLVLPGGSYMTTWPLAGMLLGGVLAGTWNREPRPAWIALPALMAGTLPALAILGPIVISLSRGIFALGMPLVMLLVSSTLFLLTPLLQPLARNLPRPAAGLLIGAGLVLWGYAGFQCGPDPVHTHPDSLGYFLEADRNTARWGGNDRHLDVWTSPFFPMGASWNKLEEFFLPGTYRCATAPVASLAAPLLVLASETEDFDGRHLRFVASSPRRAQRMHLEFTAEQRVLVGRIASGEIRPLFGKKWKVDLQVLPAEPISLDLVAVGSGPVEVRVVDVSYGLVGEAGLGVPPRPAHLMPMPNTATYLHPFETDTIRVGKTFTFRGTASGPVLAPVPAP